MKTFTGGAGATLHEPLAPPHGGQAQLVRHLRHIDGVGQILLVGKHQHLHSLQLRLTQQLLELIPRFRDPVRVVAVHHEDQPLDVVEVEPPQRPDLVLAPHVPHREVHIPVLNSVHVEADGGNRVHPVSELQFVQQCRLTCQSPKPNIQETLNIIAPQTSCSNY